MIVIGSSLLLHRGWGNQSPLVIYMELRRWVAWLADCVAWEAQELAGVIRLLSSLELLDPVSNADMGFTGLLLRNLS